MLSPFHLLRPLNICQAVWWLTSSSNLNRKFGKYHCISFFSITGTKIPDTHDLKGERFILARGSQESVHLWVAPRQKQDGRGDKGGKLLKLWQAGSGGNREPGTRIRWSGQAPSDQPPPIIGQKNPLMSTAPPRSNHLAKPHLWTLEASAGYFRSNYNNHQSKSRALSNMYIRIIFLMPYLFF